MLCNTGTARAAAAFCGACCHCFQGCACCFQWGRLPPSAAQPVPAVLYHLQSCKSIHSILGHDIKYILYPAFDDFKPKYSAPATLRRWDVDVGWNEGPTLNKRFGSFVLNAEAFDAAFFSIPAPEAAAMDAQQRLLLETSFEALGASAPCFLTGFWVSVILSINNCIYFILSICIYYHGISSYISCPVMRSSNV